MSKISVENNSNAIKDKTKIKKNSNFEFLYILEVSYDTGNYR